MPNSQDSPKMISLVIFMKFGHPWRPIYYCIKRYIQICYNDLRSDNGVEKMRSLRPCAPALLGSSAVCTQCHSSGRERSGAQCTLKSTPVIKSHLSAACTWAALLPTMDSILHWVSCSRAGSMGEMAPDLNKNCFSLSCGLRLWAQQRFFVVHQKHKTIILRGIIYFFASNDRGK